MDPANHDNTILPFSMGKLYYLEIDMSFVKIYKTGCFKNYRSNYNLVYFSSLYELLLVVVMVTYYRANVPSMMVKM